MKNFWLIEIIQLITTHKFCECKDPDIKDMWFFGAQRCEKCKKAIGQIDRY